MSKCRGAKGRRRADIEEDAWYQAYNEELRAEAAGLPCYMQYSSCGEVYPI